MSGVRVFLCVVAGYVLGNLPSADLVTRVAGSDTSIRDQGSGNPGAANAAAVLGRGWGAVVLVLDTVKGIAAARLGRRLGGSPGANAAATAAVVGHCYPAVAGFVGGKGVATAGGQIIGTLPAAAPVGVALFGVGAKTLPLPSKGYGAAVAAVAGWNVLALRAWRTGRNHGWGVQPDVSLPLSAVVSGAVMIGRFAAEVERTAEAALSSNEPR